MLNVENKTLSAPLKAEPRILVVGDFSSGIHERALTNAFRELGYEVTTFEWRRYFKDFLSHTHEKAKTAPLRFFYYRFQNKFLVGPVIRRLNRDLIKQARAQKPELIFIYRGTHILPRTLRALKKRTGAVVFGYNNDDPFSTKHPASLWRHFLRGVPLYDHIFVYRQKNIEDYRRVGYPHVSLLRSYYIAAQNFPIAATALPTQKYLCDAIFVGHFEDDGRDEYFKTLLDAGINFKLYGPEWQRSKYYAYFKEKMGEIAFLGADYNVALNSAKIVLVFLSKLNNDTYTRRVFEIIAAKRFMLSEYTDDLNSMFAQGKEAEYFKTKEELLSKVRVYLAHAAQREAIAVAGHERLLRDGHEVKDRARQVLEVWRGL